MAIAAAAGLMRGFAGVGSGMLMAPFFVHLFGPVATVGAITLMEGVATVQLLPSLHRQIAWRTIAPMGLAAAFAMPFGSWLLVTLDPASLQFGISVLVTISALLLLSGWRYMGPRPAVATAGVGMLSGVLMAVSSVGNPPVMLYLLSGGDTAATNRANFTGYFGLTLLALTILMLIGGLIPLSVVALALMLLPGYLVATWLGSRLFQRSSDLTYRRVALGILLLAGLYGMTL